MNYSFEEKLYIWLSNVFECSAVSAHALVDANGGIVELYEAVRKGTEIFPNRISLEKREKLRLLAPMQQIDDFISGLESNCVRALTFASDDYPELLKCIYDPPLVLYSRGCGDINNMSLPFAIIGSRNCTDYGESMSALFGETLARNGFTIVSGLAYGCDAMASVGALKADGNPLPTVAVLGQGVCVDKNDSTARTMNKILERGLVLSELLPHSRAFKGSYPMRNRIISGLSQGLLVVEAGLRSGTMITANAAMEQGRMVFALPGRITDRMSQGTNQMLKNGAAQAVYGTDDILEYFGITDISYEKNNRAASEDNAFKNLSPSAKKLYLALQKGERPFDTLCETTGITAAELNSYLTEMELMGLITQLPGRIYTAKSKL